MTTSAPLEFYDLVPQPGGPFFSPATTRTRLALLHKGFPFKVTELTYKDLRTGPYRDLAGAGDDGVVTVPFIKRPDGTYLRDSLAIMRWLDEAYSEKPSVVAPGDAGSEDDRPHGRDDARVLDREHAGRKVRRLLQRVRISNRSLTSRQERELCVVGSSAHELCEGQRAVVEMECSA
ncbi:unnamed protein product [Peniophora sp. CBMAI 1063]|nr:unnamed protein product [Peniophora sp. CBMAI 1063]